MFGVFPSSSIFFEFVNNTSKPNKIVFANSNDSGRNCFMCGFVVCVCLIMYSLFRVIV